LVYKQASTLPEVIPYYQLLQVFLYGCYDEYKGNYHYYYVQFKFEIIIKIIIIIINTAKSNELPALTPSQTKKLKQLSIITLSEKSQVFLLVLFIFAKVIIIR
jgi:COP9 signalosome complex subunit 7